MAAECELDVSLDEEVAAERHLAVVAPERDKDLTEVATESDLAEVAAESELDHQASSRLHEVAAARKLQKDVAAALKPLSHRETVICRICEKVIKRKNYEVHLKRNHPEENCKDLREKK